MDSFLKRGPAGSEDRHRGEDRHWEDCRPRASCSAVLDGRESGLVVKLTMIGWAIEEHLGLIHFLVDICKHYIL